MLWLRMSRVVDFSSHERSEIRSFWDSFRNYFTYFTSFSSFISFDYFRTFLCSWAFFFRE